MVNAIRSGVALLAAKIRSPSFSRFSSSTTTTALPAAMSAMARSMESIRTPTCCGSVMTRPSRALPEQLLDVLGEDVDLEVDPVADLAAAEGGAGEGLGDQAHA